MSGYDNPLKNVQQSTSAEAKTAAEKKAKQAAARANVGIVAGTRQQEYYAGLENTEKNWQTQQAESKANREKKNKEQQATRDAADKKRLEEDKKRLVGEAYTNARNLAYAAAEKYNKTGSANDLKIYNNANAAYQKATDDYRKVFGRDPGSAAPQLVQRKEWENPTLKPSTTNAPMGAKPTSTPQPQRREWENPAIGSSKFLTNDPYLQKIIDAAAKTGIDLTVAQAQAQLDGSAGGGGLGGGSSTSKSYTQYTIQQVQSAADSVFQQSIGRALSGDELKQLQQSLNAALKGSPTVTTTKGGTTTTTGGIDERGFIQQQAEMNPEFANYQKATTYFDSMMNALRGPAGGGI